MRLFISEATVSLFFSRARVPGVLRLFLYLRRPGCAVESFVLQSNTWTDAHILRYGLPSTYSTLQIIGIEVQKG